MEIRGDPIACRGWIASVLAGHRPATSHGLNAAAIVAVAGEQQVAGLLADALARDGADAGIPPDLVAALATQSRMLALQELAQHAHARLALAALGEAGIPALVLKGGALAYWLYADPALRPRSDLDLLVANRAEAANAERTLAAAGYAPVAGVGVDAATDYEIALQRHSHIGSHAIDLHWRLLNNATLARAFGFDELRAHSIPIPNLHPHARGLGRVHALAHALLHRVTNMPSGRQDRLVWLYDIHLLARGCNRVDWDFLLRLCARKRIAAPCLDGLVACRAAFATGVPGDVEAGLARLSAREAWNPGAIDQGAMDRAHFAALPWNEKIHWIRRKWFPSPEFMRHRYGARGGFGLLRAYAGRWWVGIRRGLGG